MLEFRIILDKLSIDFYVVLFVSEIAYSLGQIWLLFEDVSCARLVGI